MMKKLRQQIEMPHDPILPPAPGTPKNDADFYAWRIREKLSHLPVRSVQYTTDNIKTGYICDINAYLVTQNNGDAFTVIFKLSNLGNELSKVAVELDMYEKEALFFEKLSTLVGTTISVPKAHGVIRDQRGRVGIILEDLRVHPGMFNCDLNTDVQLLLDVVSAAFHMHDTYYFERREDVIPSMANLVMPRDITYYQELVRNRFKKFIARNAIFMSKQNKEVCERVAANYERIAGLLSEFPLSFCHGDMKSPNIFYKFRKRGEGVVGSAMGRRRGEGG